jgi:hypothetical protein
MAAIDCILDTNVLINAEGDQSAQTPLACREACLHFLVAVMAGDYQLVMDGGADPDGSEALAEYRRNLHAAGARLGELFLRWLLQHWGTSVQLVPITPAGESYEEFPSDSRLKEFDPRDHKWVALAVAHKNYNERQADIIQSADFKWLGFIAVFAEYGVNVRFICS